MTVAQDHFPRRDVGLDEALFMFGACVSFAAYMVQKHWRVGST